VVDPSDQVFPVALDEVNVTEPPEQKVVGPPALIVGVVGPEVIVTLVAVDVETQEPFVIVTE
jgi:hypothetical protein